MVLNATLVCADCGCILEIREGVLRLLPEQKHLDQLADDEQRVRDLQADQYDAHFKEWENKSEVSAVLEDCRLFVDKRVLDLACGTGRITTHLVPLSRAILAVDFSEQSLRILARKLPSYAKVGLVWADATQLRLAPGWFDTIISTQLLEHIVEGVDRSRLVQTIHDALANGGSFLFTAYYHSPLRQILRHSPNGFHAGGIFYHRFSKREITESFGSRFNLLRIRPMHVDRRIVPRLPFVGDWLAERLDRTPAASLAGRLLFVKAQKEHKSIAPDIGFSASIGSRWKETSANPSSD